jgi:hypothetical protein
MVNLLPKFDNMETDNDVLKRLKTYLKIKSIQFGFTFDRRDKQIEFGKNTVDYDKYVEVVKKVDRKDFMPRWVMGYSFNMLLNIR